MRTIKMNDKKLEFTFAQCREIDFLDKAKKLAKKVPVAVKKVESFFRKISMDGWEKEVDVPYVTYRLITDSFVKKAESEHFKFLGLIKEENGAPPVVVSFDQENPIHKRIDKSFDFTCSVCNKKDSRRNKKFFFEDKKSKNLLNIGSKCAQSFLGIDVYKALNISSQKILDFVEDVEEDYSGAGGYGVYFDHQKHIDFLIQYFKGGHPYISQKRAEESLGASAATSSIAAWFFDTRENRADFEEKVKIEKTFRLNNQSVEDYRNKIYEYYKNYVVESDFDYNLVNCFNFRTDKIGLLCCGVFKWFKENQEIETKKFENKIRAHFPEDEIKNELVTCTTVASYESNYGPGLRVVFENDKYQFVWFSSSANSELLKEGEKYIIKKGKIKTRGEYNNKKQNIVRLRNNWIEKRSN